MGVEPTEDDPTEADRIMQRRFRVVGYVRVLVLVAWFVGTAVVTFGLWVPWGVSAPAAVGAGLVAVLVTKVPAVYHVRRSVFDTDRPVDAVVSEFEAGRGVSGPYGPAFDGVEADPGRLTYTSDGETVLTADYRRRREGGAVVLAVEWYGDELVAKSSLTVEPNDDGARVHHRYAEADRSPLLEAFVYRRVGAHYERAAIAAVGYSVVEADHSYPTDPPPTLEGPTGAARG